MSDLDLFTRRPQGFARARRRTLIAVLTGSAFAGGCTNDVQPSAPHLERAYVTGAAAAALRSDGTFAMPDSVISPLGQVTRAQAADIARRYVVDVGHSLVGPWSKSFGSPIRLADLAPCKVPVYAASPYASVRGNVSGLTGRVLGPHWVVPICINGGRIAVVLSFSALATQLVVPAGANPQYELGDMLSVGVPADANVSLYEPEAAAALAYTLTGKRVSQVPSLVMNPRPQVPQLVRWRVQLEAPVAVAGEESGLSRSRATVLVGFASLFRVSGLLDINPAGPPAVTSIVDADTKSAVQLGLSPLAPTPVELVTVREP